MEVLTTRLFPSSLRSVFFQCDTTTDNAQILIATTSTRPGMERLFVMMAFHNAVQDAIQSRVSAPFKRFTTSYVIENGSRLPGTEGAVSWRQRFINRGSNVWNSPSLAPYPHPKLLEKASERTCGHPCRDKTDIFGPAAFIICPEW